VALSDYRGQVVLVLFWQSTCPDCGKALPEARRLWEKYRRRGLAFLGINLDHDPQTAIQYLQSQGYTDQLTLWDSFEAAMGVVTLYEVPYVPFFLIVDRRGILRFRGVYPAVPTEAELERWL